jgi:hypothetical protein
MKAVFVFCEGNHDVTFVARSLGQVPKMTWVGDPIGKLPSPLGPVPDPANPTRPKIESLIAKRYSSRTLDDLNLKAAAHAPLPAFETIVKANDTIYVLIRCHGDGAAEAAIVLVSDMKAVLNPAFGTDIKEFATAFLLDADSSLSAREAAFAKEYADLLGAAGAPTHGTWVKGKDIPVGLYVFHNTTTKSGTLEEILAPLVQVEWPTRWAAADTYLAAHVVADEPISKKSAERLKAQITVTGQFRTPGDPMTTVLADRKWGLPGKHFSGPESTALVTFLQGAPW